MNRCVLSDRPLFLNFSYVCPEPVLVKRPFFDYINGSKRIAVFLSVGPCDPQHLCIGAIISGNFKLVLGMQKCLLRSIYRSRFNVQIGAQNAATTQIEPDSYLYHIFARAGMGFGWGRGTRTPRPTTARRDRLTARLDVSLISSKIRASTTTSPIHRYLLRVALMYKSVGFKSGLVAPFLYAVV
eukprot:COSAG06_NODE_447_length_15632_cov_47.212193_12_plen_184_part_00